MRKFIICIVLLALCTGCASPEPEVMVMDFGKKAGAYIIGYSSDLPIRTMFEDRLVADLADRDITAWPSYPDLPDVSAMTRDSVLGAANAKSALFVIVAEEVAPGEKGAIPKEGRITHEHPDLQDFYEHTRPPNRAYPPESEVFVEVSAYLIQDGRAKLFWSGTTWSFQADGKGGAIPGISETIADAIAKGRNRFVRQ